MVAILNFVLYAAPLFASQPATTNSIPTSRITKMQDGQCVIGMQKPAMIPLIGFDVLVNVSFVGRTRPPGLLTLRRRRCT